MKVLFIIPYPVGLSPSQRFRFEQYFKFLDKNQIIFRTRPFLSKNVYRVLYKKGYIVQKVGIVVLCYLRRILVLFESTGFDYIFIHREASPLGPPVFEWIIAWLMKKKIIYDFDDAIWLSNVSESNKFIQKLKRPRNVAKICKWAYKVSCGNEFLCKYAHQYNENTIYNPTTIDTQNHHNQIKKHGDGKFVIGWTGTHSTIKYLNMVTKVISELEAELDFDFLVISDVKPENQLKSLKYIPWKKETEVDDLMRFTVGIMPLPNNEWAQGKCGFKALQYMALGIPALASPVGSALRIIDDGKNGFLCPDHASWKINLKKLMTDRSLLADLSSNTRPKITREFSLESNRNNFLHLFQ